MKGLRILVALLCVIFASTSQAAIVAQDYSGDVTFCPPVPGLCGLFGATDGMLELSFDLDNPMGGGAITDATAITNVDIRIVTLTGFLEFVNGGSLAADFFTDAVGNIISGNLTLQATGATSGVVLDALINLGPGTLTGATGGPGVINAGEWEATTQGAFVAAGTGSFAAVPVPAAVWLFGSALGLLGWLRRKAT